MKKILIIFLSTLIFLAGCSVKGDGKISVKNKDSEIEVKNKNQVDSESMDSDNKGNELKRKDDNQDSSVENKGDFNKKEPQDNENSTNEVNNENNKKDSDKNENGIKDKAETKSDENDKMTTDNVNENSSENEDIVEEKELVTVFDIFPKEIGFAWSYIGPIDYETKERLVNIKEDLELNETRYYIEGFDYSNMRGIIYDNSYCKVYSVSDNNLYLEISTLKSPLLLGDKLNKDESWEGDYFTDNYGPIEAIFKIKEIDDYKVTIKITPKSYEEESIPEGYSETMTFGRGQGVIENAVTFPFEDSKDTYIFPIRLNSTSMETGEENLNLYYNVSDELEGFYNVEESFYRLLKGQIKSNLRKGVWEEENLRSRYKEELTKLPQNEIRAVSEAYNIAYIFYDNTKDSFYIFDGINEYENRLKSLNTYFVEQKPKIAEEKWFNYFVFGKAFMRSSEKLRTNLSSMEQTKLSILKNNYLHLNISEDERFYRSLDFIEFLWFPHNAEDLFHYKNFKEIEYLNSSYYYDREYNENKKYLKLLLEVIEFYEKEVNNGKTQYEEILSEIVSYYLPMNVEIFDKFQCISIEYLNSYKEYLQRNKEGKYYSVINEIVNLVEENSGYYSKELHEYLIQEKLISNEIEFKENQFIKEQNQLFSGIKENYIELDKIQGEEIIEVSNAIEFLDAIGDNRIIKVLGNISLYTDYSPVDNPKVSIWDGSCQIRDVKNLTIVGVGKIPVSITAASSGDVFGIRDCENITFRNVSLGHLNSYCKGPVIYGNNVKGLKVEDSIIYGCGLIGLEYVNVSGMEVNNTLIWDCSSFGISFQNVSDGIMENVIITQNGKNAVNMNMCHNIKLNHINVFNNFKEDGDGGKEDTIYIDGSEDIFFKKLINESSIKNAEINNCTNVQFE